MRALIASLAGAALLSACGSASAKPSPPATTPLAAGTAACLPSVSTAPAPARLSAIQMVDPSHGWVVGGNSIFATRDGQHWTAAYRGAQEFVSIDFVSASVGWAVARNQLLGTIDGGNCWIVLGEPSQPLRSVHFADPAAGWGVVGGTMVTNARPGQGFNAPDNGGALVATTDGGRTWSPVNAPANVQTVCFSDHQQGWLGTSDDAVYRSVDGGAHWSKSLTRPGNYPYNRTLVECAAPHAAWADFEGGPAAAGHIPYIAYATVDGSHWQTVLEEQMTEEMVAPNVPYGPGCYPGSFSVIDPQDAAFVGDCAITSEARTVLAGDGGRTLTRTGAIGGATATHGASFLSRQRGWVLAQRADNLYVIEATFDGGQTWSAQLTLP